MRLDTTLGIVLPDGRMLDDVVGRLPDGATMFSLRDANAELRRTNAILADCNVQLREDNARLAKLLRRGAAENECQGAAPRLSYRTLILEIVAAGCVVWGAFALLAWAIGPSP